MGINNNILEEANKITHKDRQAQYGPPKDNFEKIARIFNAITGMELSAEAMAYVQIATKLAREQHKHKRDNLVDLAGYAWVLSEIKDDSVTHGKK